MFHSEMNRQLTEDRRAAYVAGASRRRLLGALSRRSDPAPTARLSGATVRTTVASEYDRAA
jgi:hypothetical protein